MARLKPIIQRDTSQETEDLTFRKVGRLKVSFAEAILIASNRSEGWLPALRGVFDDDIIRNSLFKDLLEADILAVRHVRL